MSSQKPKKRRILKVQVSFEVSRVSDECLAGAYEQVIPVHSRVAQADSQQPSQHSEPTRVSVESSSFFDSSDFGYGDSVTKSLRS